MLVSLLLVVAANYRPSLTFATELDELMECSSSLSLMICH